MKKSTKMYLFFACIALYIIFLLALSLSVSDFKNSTSHKTNTKVNNDIIDVDKKDETEPEIIYKHIQSIEELKSLISTSYSGEGLPLILIGVSGNYIVDGIDTGISSLSNANAFGENGAYVLFIENINESDIELLYSVLYSNGKTKEFKVNKETGEVISEANLDIEIGENGHWYINGNDTFIDSNGSQYDESCGLTKEEWLKQISDGTLKFDNKMHTIVFYPENGDYPYSIKFFDNNSFINMNEPTKEGYTFVGWLNQDNKIMEYGKTVIDKDFELHAVYRQNEYRLVLQYNNGQDNEYLYVHYNDKLNLSIPTRKGFEFLGWYNKDSKVSENGIKDNAILVAKWRLIYTLNTANSMNELCNSLFTIKGYSMFDGWYCDDMLVLYPEDQVFIRTMTSMNDYNRASSTSSVINDETKLDIVGETKSKKTAMIQELDYESEPRYYVRT